MHTEATDDPVIKTHIVINSMWASILSTLLVCFVTAGIAYAWDSHSTVAVLQAQVEEMKQINVPVKITELQGKIDVTAKGVDDIKQSVTDQGRKLDFLVMHMSNGPNDNYYGQSENNTRTNNTRNH